MQSNSARLGEDSFPSVDDLLRHSQYLFLALNQAGASGLAGEVNTLLSELRQHEHFQFAALALQHPDSKAVAVLSQSGESQRLRDATISPALLGPALGLRQSIEVHDAANESRFRDLAQSKKTSGFHSFRIVPVSTLRHTHGALILGRDKPGEFATEHVMRSNETAQRVALLLENSLITDLLVSHQERLGTLFDISTLLASTVNVREIFEQVSIMSGNWKTLLSAR